MFFGEDPFAEMEQSQDNEEDLEETKDLIKKSRTFPFPE
jgi:hypothetical protein